MSAMHSSLLFRESDFPAHGPALADRDRSEPDDSGRRALLCRTCDLPVARMRDRIRVDGKHVHALFNPSGVLFEVACFAQAPGCRFEGEFTSAFTWFAGYAWRFAMCARCAAHLGWEYRGADGGFAGLIMAELRESRS